MSDKKIYTGKDLINSSFFVHYILKVKIPDIEKLCLRIDEIIKENPEFCIRENFTFMSNAITALAIYEMFRNKGYSKQQAYYKTAQPMWEYCRELSYRYYKKTRSKKTFKKLPDLLANEFSKNKKAFNIEIPVQNENEIRLKCGSCIYEAFFCKYFLKDIAAMFCWGENIIFGSMKTVDFKLSDTLILNNKPCEFILKPYDL